jgi:hypothetical protein
MGLTVAQNNIIQIAIKTSACLSIFGSLSTLAALAFIPRLRTQVNMMICMVAIADLIASISFSFGATLVNNSAMCQAQGFLIEWFMLSSVFWTFCISAFCYTCIASLNSVHHLNYLQKFYHAFAWGVPLILAILPMTFNSIFQSGPGYNNSTLWCWIAPAYQQWRMWIFYVPLWALFILTVVLYSLIWRTVTRIRKRASMNTKLQKSRNRLTVKTTVFAVAFFITWMPATINRLIGLFDTNVYFSLFLLHSIFTPLQGFVSFVIFFSFAFVSQKDKEQLPEPSIHLDENASSVSYKGHPTIASMIKADHEAAIAQRLAAEKENETIVDSNDEDKKSDIVEEEIISVE